MENNKVNVSEFIGDLTGAYKATVVLIRKYQTLRNQDIMQLNEYLTDTFRAELDILGYQDSNEAYEALIVKNN